MAVSSGRSPDDTGKDLARWLQEAARRTIARAQPREEKPVEPPQVVLAHLEALFGRKLATRNDVDCLLADLWNQDVERHRSATRLRILRETTLLVFLVSAYLHYQYWDVSLQIAAMQSVQVFVPVHVDPQKVQPYRPGGGFPSGKV